MIRTLVTLGILQWVVVHAVHPSPPLPFVVLDQQLLVVPDGRMKMRLGVELPLLVWILEVQPNARRLTVMNRIPGQPQVVASYISTIKKLLLQLPYLLPSLRGS